MLLIFFVIYLIKEPKRNQQLLPRCARLGGGGVSVSLLWFATWFWVLFFILKFNSCQTIRAKTTKVIFRLQDVCSPQLTMPSALMVISSDITHFHCYSAFASPYPPKKKACGFKYSILREGKEKDPTEIYLPCNFECGSRDTTHRKELGVVYGSISVGINNLYH